MNASAAHQRPPAADSPSGEKQAYGQILKSSALIGGSTLLGIAIGIVRTKIMAVLLGPTGFGLMSLYSAILEVAINIANMGTTSSGVRQVAEAAGSGDLARVARTATALRYLAALLGVVGAALMIGFAAPLSKLTFASDAYAGSLALLALAVFLGCVSGAQGALIQGMRRISDLAAMGVVGGVLGAVISIAIVFVLGEAGLVLSLVAGAAMRTAITWWYSRKAVTGKAPMSAAQTGYEALALLRLGFAFMLSALLMTGTAYAVRLILLRESGVESAGLYQSAWTLGGLYLGFILQAMGADYYPRLTAVAGDREACNRLVNQQARIGLLLAGPGVLATLTFAPLVIWLFYTPEFADAVGILRWICLGMTLRIVIWPLSFIILAKGAKGFFVSTELAWAIAHLGFAWLGVRHFGADGAGIAFFASYVVYGLLIFPISRHLTGFAWSAENRQACVVTLLVIAAVFGCVSALPPWPGMAIGAAATLLCAIHSIRTLAGLVSLETFPPSLRRLLSRFGFLPSLPDR